MNTLRNILYGIAFVILSLVTSMRLSDLLCRIFETSEVNSALGAIIGFLMPSVFMVPIIYINSKK